MEIKIDPRLGTPIYIQIMEQVRHLMASGQLKTGDQLPTVRQLAADLRVNWNTVARAYRLLDEAGLISTQQGRGTYIWDKPSEETERSLRHEALSALTHQYLLDARQLGAGNEDIREAFEAAFAGQAEQP